MGLIGRYRIINRVLGTGKHGGSIELGRSSRARSGAVRGRYTTLPQRAGTPTGYGDGIVIPIKGGELVGIITMSSSVTAHVASARLLVADIEMANALSASVGLITSMQAAITNDSVIACSLVGTVALQADIANAHTVAVAVNLIANMSTAMTMTNTLAASLFGTASMAVAIQSYTEISSEGVADAVWSALASQNNTPGTMGEKLNDAGSAGDPWSTTVPGAYADGTAGALMGRLLTMPLFLALKDKKLGG